MLSRIATAATRGVTRSVAQNARAMSAAAGAGDIVGIDLGTTNSCVAVMEGITPKVVANSEGVRTTPSYVAFTADGETLVGETARRQATTNTAGTAYAVKRLIGRKFSDPETAHDQEMVSYKIVAAENGDAHVELNGKVYAPSQIAAQILTKMATAGSDYLGRPVKDAVVTVPAYFSDSQRKATENAGTIAGLKVRRIINEPTAAALAYGMQTGEKESKTMAVFDLGGGTFDVSVLEMDGDVFHVRSTNGDTFLGGEDFDNALLKYLLSDFKTKTGIDLSNDDAAKQRVREAAERVKCELSSAVNSKVNLPYLTMDATGPKHMTADISRAQFEMMVSDLIDRTRKPCVTALADAGLTASDIHEVLLVGGMSRMPRVQEMVKDIFGLDPSKGVNPDEAVAMGAAIQGGVLKGDVKDIILVDVTPLSLGIETYGGVMTALIPKNTNIPTKKTKEFSTAEDGQTSVLVKVLQGERKMAVDNNHLGDFMLDGITKAPARMAKISVTFDINSSGVVTVSASDMASGNEANVTVESSGGLSKEEMQRMVEEAAASKESDQKRADLAEANNQAETLIRDTEKALSENKGLLSAEEEKKVADQVSTLKGLGKSDDLGALNDSIKSTKESALKLMAAAYEKKVADRKAATASTEEKKDNVKEAEVEKDPKA